METKYVGVFKFNGGRITSLYKSTTEEGEKGMRWVYHLKDHKGVEVGHTYSCFVRYNHIGKYHIVLAPSAFFRQKSEVKKIIEEFNLVKDHYELVRWNDAYRWT